MKKNEKSLEERFDQHFKERDNLDKKYWSESDRLQDEYDVLMKELSDS